MPSITGGGSGTSPQSLTTIALPRMILHLLDVFEKAACEWLHYYMLQ
jgi:hypothetical protein|eukprot:COSAG02_NODE_7135_length_3164_cov_16.656444_4_plen_47_part_00